MENRRIGIEKKVYHWKLHVKILYCTYLYSETFHLIKLKVLVMRFSQLSHFVLPKKAVYIKKVTPRIKLVKKNAFYTSKVSHLDTSEFIN